MKFIRKRHFFQLVDLVFTFDNFIFFNIYLCESKNDIEKRRSFKLMPLETRKKGSYRLTVAKMTLYTLLFPSKIVKLRKREETKKVAKFFPRLGLPSLQRLKSPLYNDHSKLAVRVK